MDDGRAEVQHFVKRLTGATEATSSSSTPSAEWSCLGPPVLQSTDRSGHTEQW